MAATPDFWRGKRVLLTGHTGFKGAWAARWLTRLQARVTGFALPPCTDPSLHQLLRTKLEAEHLADLRDLAAVKRAVTEARPQIVLHLGAQALLPHSYRDPVATFATNVMGTVHVLEALRDQPGVEAVVIVTTDKVYANDGLGRAFVESDRLGGDDPYSASKASAEMAVHAYTKSFLDGQFGIGTARAGNVIGGGDWSADRLVPDIVRAASEARPLVLRRPEATRPWQHVLDPLAGYLMYAEALAKRRLLPPSLNFGPDDATPVTVGEIADKLTAAFGVPGWRHQAALGIGEKSTLALDASAATSALGWRPRLATTAAFEQTVSWYKAWREGADVARLTDRQIAEFEALGATPAPVQTPVPALS